jgi:hypothetical protein
MRLGSIFVLGAALSLAAPLQADAQSVTPVAADTVSIVPGPDYAAAGFHRFLWGAHYRDAWTSSIRVPLLDLSVYAGGLTPLSAGGGLQTKSLWFAGEDGKPYAFRSVYKNATPLVPELLRNTFVESIAQDQMSTQFPAGALVADSLLVAAGVPHARPSLWVLPDDASLGEFREEFAGVLGLLQERPVDEEEAIAAFAGAEDVIGSEELMDLVQAIPAERVDSRAYLTARLLDMLLGDWDRHADQWKWATFADSTPGWRPIPRDRDQAFAKFDGLLPSLGRQRFPAVSTFREKYGNVVNLHYNARFLDRRFLTELERAAWDSTAAVLACPRYRRWRATSSSALSSAAATAYRRRAQNSTPCWRGSRMCTRPMRPTAASREPRRARSASTCTAAMIGWCSAGKAASPSRCE